MTNKILKFARQNWPLLVFSAIGVGLMAFYGIGIYMVLWLLCG